MFYYLQYRHGERYPDFTLDLSGLEKTLNQLIKNTTGISKSVHVKFPWKSPFRTKDLGLLSRFGEKQLYYIGQRYARRFPEIFRGRFGVADFNLTSSCVPRTSQSGISFSLGYLKGKGHVTPYRFQPTPIMTYPCGTDKLLRFGEACARWRDHAAKIGRPKIIAEVTKFSKLKIQAVVKKVQENLGLKNEEKLNEGIVQQMFTACSFEISALGRPRHSGWCSLFDTEDLKIFDYYFDLLTYYSFGPAYKINIDSSCALLKDIYSNMLSVAGNDTSNHRQYKVIARFAHGETLVPLLGKLGLFVDTKHLEGDNYDEMKNRKFKFGKLAPLSGNVAFVLYKCSAAKGHDYKVQMYHNERLIQLPSCSSKVDCTLQKFQSYYEDMVKNCDFDKICEV